MTDKKINSIVLNIALVFCGLGTGMGIGNKNFGTVAFFLSLSIIVLFLMFKTNEDDGGE